jgi:hypothetical protein
LRTFEFSGLWQVFKINFATHLNFWTFSAEKLLLDGIESIFTVFSLVLIGWWTQNLHQCLGVSFHLVHELAPLRILANFYIAILKFSATQRFSHDSSWVS